MATRPSLELEFDAEGCPDCGTRKAKLPGLPVALPDDFDWTARDFEGFRQFMLEDLAAADPERQRWTEADMEVVIVEVLAAGLDRASHALDGVFAERFPQTARLPSSLINLLRMIDGVDNAWSAVATQLVPQERDKYGFSGGGAQLDKVSSLKKALTARPQLMDVARVSGLSKLNEIVSFISLADLERFLESCPLITQVMVRYVNEGGLGIYEAVALFTESELRFHDLIAEIGAGRQAFIEFFQEEKERSIPPDQTVHPLRLIDEDVLLTSSIRTALTRLVEPLLPMGTRVRFSDGVRVGVFLRLCVHVEANYFRSEVEMAVREVLSTRPGQFFDPESHGFGDVIYLSDLQEALMKLAGVEGVVINRFQIVGRHGTDATASGVLVPELHEALTLDTDNPTSETGYVVLKMTGGQLG